MHLILRVLLVTSLASLSTSAFSAWIKFAENDRLIAYYEPVTSNNAEGLLVWVMYDYKSEQHSERSGRRYASQKGQQEVDCIGEKSRTVFFTWHAGRMGDGPVVYTGSNPLPWEPNSPNSLARALSLAVCSRM